MKKIICLILALCLLSAAAFAEFDASSAITVYSHEDGSGARGAFIELFGVEQKNDAGEKVDYTTEEAIITNSTSVMLTGVAGDPSAIGYVSIGSLNDTVKALNIDDAEATADNIKSGDYAIARPFNIAARDGASEAAQDFISYILSAEGQAVIEANGYIAVAGSEAYAGAAPEGKVVVAGSSSVTPVMEKLAEAYAAVNPNAQIEIQQSDSTTGINGAIEGLCDIGMASRDLKDEEIAAGLTGTVIAMEGIAAVALICMFLFANSIPAFLEIGPLNFLLGKQWKSGNDLYGIFPMIVVSLYVTAGALVLGVPVAILTALFLARFCPKPLYRLLKPAINLLAGIPSVVYGFFGLVVLVPLVRNTFGGTGSSILTASVLLAMMILPTIISQAEAALRPVPESCYEGSLALGASHERSAFFAVLPAAKSGVMVGVILGVGRAIGETMAVIMAAGNQPRIPDSILKGVRTLTTNIVMDISSNCITALIGPSGCGKSTLLKSLNRMNDLVEGCQITGSVTLDGEDIYHGMDVNLLRRRVGMVFQKPNPFPMSVYDNIAYGPRTHGIRARARLDEIVERSLRDAAIWDEVKDRLKKSALGLSGGQQQRLCIARALAVEPEVLLMDEPTSALDPISTSKVEELALSLRERYTIVIVTHNMQQALRISDCTGFFLLGDLVEFGDTEQLFSSPRDSRTEDYITGRFG